jgi:hypothetical protein
VADPAAAKPTSGVIHRRLTAEELDARVAELAAELEVAPGSAEEYELRRELEQTQWVYADGEGLD